MENVDPAAPVAYLEPSLGRRVGAVAGVATVGALMVWVGVTSPPESLLWRIFLLAGGVGALVICRGFWNVTSTRIVLTREGLFEEGGRVIARIENIEKAERGAFAFKPSNGFAVTLHNPMERAWVPGLWWRFGRHLGVGGVTPGSQGKQMADILAALLQDRSR